MRKSGWMVMAVLACVSLTNAAVIIDDDFNGSSLDTSVWTTQMDGSATVTVADSKVSVRADKATAALTSLAAVAPGVGETVTATATNLTISDAWGFHMQWGFASGPRIEWQKFGSAWGAKLAMDGKTALLWSYPAPTQESSLEISWTPTQVTVTRGGTMIFDSLVNGPSDGGSWTIPTAASTLHILTYNNQETITADRLTMSVVPEPATVALLSLGGLMLRRKH